MSVSERLKAYCKSNHITQDNLVSKGFGTKQTVNNYINGNTEPKAGFLEKFIKEFRLSAEWLMTGELKNNTESLDTFQNDTNETPISPYITECKDPQCQKRISELEDDKIRLKKYNDILEMENQRLIAEKGGAPPGYKPEGGMEKIDKKTG